MRPDSPNRKPDDAQDPAMLALLALGWILADGARADRLLALTGMDADTLRAGIGEQRVLAAWNAVKDKQIREIIDIRKSLFFR